MTKKPTCTLVTYDANGNFMGNIYNVGKWDVLPPKSHHLTQRVYENGNVEFTISKTKR